MDTRTGDMSEAQHQDPLRYTVSELMMMMMLHTCVKHVFFFFSDRMLGSGRCETCKFDMFQTSEKKNSKI